MLLHLTPSILSTITRRHNHILRISSQCGLMGHDLVNVPTGASIHSTMPLINLLDMRKHIYCLLTISWNTEWTRSHGNGKLRNIKLKDWTKRLSKSYEHSRLLGTTANRLFLGHSHITHNYILSKKPPLIWTECDQSLWTYCVIRECRMYRLHRLLPLTQGFKTEYRHDLR